MNFVVGHLVKGPPKGRRDAISNSQPWCYASNDIEISTSEHQYSELNDTKVPITKNINTAPPTAGSPRASP